MFPKAIRIRSFLPSVKFFRNLSIVAYAKRKLRLLSHFMKNPPAPVKTKKPSALMTQQRRTKIAELVHAQGAMRVTNWRSNSTSPKSPSATILRPRSARGARARPRRRDRENRGRMRHHAAPGGGALAQHIEEKRRIAQAAAQLVAAGRHDHPRCRHHGRGNGAVAREVAPLTVVTNALNVALEIGAAADANARSCSAARSPRILEHGRAARGAQSSANCQCKSSFSARRRSTSITA